MSEPRDHAYLAPSSAHIWGPDGCAYYPTMATSHPQTGDDPEAREGTAAHHLLASRLLGVVVDMGELDPDGTPITAEMFECTDRMVTDIEALRVAYPDLEECTEEKVQMPMIHKDNWGTADWFAISRAARKIWVKDFKFGHMFVDAFENWQLADYLLGVVHHFMLTEAHEWTASLAIYQPRSYHEEGPVKTWELGGNRFRDLGAALAGAAAAAMGRDPAMRTGDHCKFCEGRIDCPAFRRSTENGIDLSLRAVPDNMDAAAKGTYRTMLALAIKRLEGMATGLDADIEATIRAGGAVPGWELKPGQPRLAWTATIEEVYAMGDMMGVDVRKPDAITPTQAIKAGIDEAVIMEYAKRPPAALKVAQSSTNSAAKAFT